MTWSSEAIRPRARRLPPAERREQLLGCALAVFARRGLAGARHTEVAAEAGVAVPTVFVYFPTRDELISAVLDAVERFYVDLAIRVHASPAPAPQVLLAHATAFADSVEQHPDCARVWLNWSGAVRDDVWPRYLAFEERIVSVLVGTLERGQREGTISRELVPEDGARITIGAAYLIVQMKLSGRPAAQIERFLQSLVAALAGGITPPPATL